MLLDLLPCAICYGEAKGNEVQGLFFGVVLLLGVTLVVLSAFGLFFVNLARRSSMAGKHSQAVSLNKGGV